MRPQKFNILTDENNNVVLDNDGEWLSADGSVTPNMRRKRLKRLRHYLESNNVDWGPKIAQVSDRE